MFIFIRQDISIAQQLVQSNHATQKLFSTLPSEGTPNIVMIGVPDEKALNRVLAKLKQNQLTHYAWSEPDFDLGFTAIVTAPLSEEQKTVLGNYRVYRGGAAQASCGVMPNSPTIGRNSSGQEHRAFSPEVAG